jgi:hypothetical protein
MAVAVSVRAGQEINGEDFTLQPASGVTVSGTVINNLPGGMVLANGQLSREISSLYLVRRNPNFNEVPQSFPNILGMAGGVVLDAGTNFPFEIRDVLPGTYDLYPIFAVGLGIGARGLASPSPSYYTGRTLVEVGSENVTNVRAVIRPGVDLKGHISVIGFPPNSQSPETDPVKNIRVRIVPLDNRPSQLNNSAFVTPLDNDGTFTLTNLIDARYRIASIEGLPYGTYVSDIRLGMRSLYDEGIFEIGKETPDSLEITLKYGNAAIGGAVLDAQHNPAVSARVILIPDAPRRQNFILYGSATTNAAGRFAIYDIAPGSYKLFAWENLPTSAEKNPKFIREYEGRGVSMTISPGTTMTNLQVPLILDEQH